MGTNNKSIRTIEDRFFEKVQKTESCWIWKGAVKDTGYGVMQKGARGRGLIRVHRFSYEYHTRETIPKGKVLMHSCNNKVCVNPDHLSVGTYGENLKDAWRDGLRKTPEKHIGIRSRKLSDEEISEIIKAPRDRGMLPILAKRFCVSTSTIWKVRKTESSI